MSPAPRSQILSAENDTTLRLLLNDVAAADGLALAFVWAPDAATERAVVAALEERLPRAPRILDAERWPPDRPFWAWLLEEQPPDPETPVVVRLPGKVAVSLPANGMAPPLRQWNSNRNHWKTRTPHYWIVVLPPAEQLRRLAREAGRAAFELGDEMPDVYSIRSGDYYFDPVPPEDAPPEPAMSLPSLTRLLGPGSGREFARLLDQLLLAWGQEEHFDYEPVRGDGGDGGVDGGAPDGAGPAYPGRVIFQFKFLADLSASGSRRQVEQSLEELKKGPEWPSVRHWILITPEDLTPGQRTWLKSLETPGGPQVHHFGRAWIEQYLRKVPSLFARYYPHEAAHLAMLPGYDGHPFDRFEEEYRRGVVGQWEVLRTLGLPADATRGRTQFPLKELFVPLRFVPWKGGGEPLTLAELLRQRTSPVILGDPGTGKTTLLAFLALLFTGAAALEGDTPATGPVPFHVSLRDFLKVRREHPAIATVVDYLAYRARSDLQIQRAHPAFFEQALRMGEAVVLFDGLDEAGRDEGRAALAGLVKQFRSRYPDCPVWVTCRVHGYTRNVELADFPAYTLAPLNEAEVADFIGKWHRIHYASNEREGEEQRKALLEAVNRSPSVRRLSGNPLLLTLMAFLHYGQHVLPQNRGELLDQCVEMLLKTWNEPRRRVADPHPFDDLVEKRGVDVPTQREYLAGLALHVQERPTAAGAGEEERGLFTRAEALECLTVLHLKRSEQERPGMSRRQAEGEMADFLDYLADRTGLLRVRPDGSLSFLHLSFQEHLAAWRLEEEREPEDQLREFFRRHLGETAWEEVLLLRLYLLSTATGRRRQLLFSVTASLVRGLEAEPDGGAPEQWLTLARAVRDNLALGSETRAGILAHVLEFWLREPVASGPWYGVLEEIRLFAPLAAEAFRFTLSSVWAADPDLLRAVTALHLHVRLASQSGSPASTGWGLPDAAGTRLRARGDLPALSAYLSILPPIPELGPLPEAEATPDEWLAALATFDGPDVFHRTLAWMGQTSEAGVDATPAALAAAARLISCKVNHETASRAAFAQEQAGSAGAVLFRHCGELAVEWPAFYRVRVPHAAFRVGSGSGGVIPPGAVNPSAPQTGDTFLRGVLRAENHSDAPLADWAAGQMRAALTPHLGTSPELAPRILESSEDFGRTFGRVFVGDFVREFVRQFLRALGRQFVGAFDREFDRAFASFFFQEFGRVFGQAFGREFVREFDREFDRAFGRAFVREFVRGFGRKVGRDVAPDLVRSFVRAFGRDFCVEPDAPDWQQQWERALAREEHAEAAIRLLESERFWNFVYAWWWCWMPRPDTDSPRNPATTCSADEMIVENPFVLSLAITQLWSLGGVVILLAAGRRLYQRYPTGDVPDEEWERELLRHPVNVYAAALAWEERVAPLAAAGVRLAGPHGCLVLAHAAYAELMTGLDLTCPAWTALLEGRDRDDAELEGYYRLYESVRVVDAGEEARDARD